jgi:hypothetical protein
MAKGDVLISKSPLSPLFQKGGPELNGIQSPFVKEGFRGICNGMNSEAVLKEASINLEILFLKLKADR